MEGVCGLRFWPIGLAIWLLVVGCGRQMDPGSRELGLDFYGKLPGLSATPDPELRAEYIRIVEEAGTPEQLTQAAIPDEENIAAGFRQLFPPDKLDSILLEAERIMPPAKLGFNFDPVRLHRASVFWKQYQQVWQQARKALDRPRCQFGIRFIEGDGADLSFIKVVWIVARLEMFYAAQQLHKKAFREAISSLELLLRLAHCLGAEKHFEPRGQAAFLRSEALLLLEAIVRRPEIQRTHLEQLFDLLQGHLAQWPPDVDAWIGERALGMHAYELVRDGRLLQLAKPEEIEAMGGQAAAVELAEVAKQNVNQDELYYLRTMRRILEACSEPYYRRAALFQQIRLDLQQKRNTSEFPLVAGYLLLPSIENGHRLQAKDRALCEAWAVGLALGAGQTEPPYQINPLTGQPYKIFRQDGRIEVVSGDSAQLQDEFRILVPDLASKSAVSKGPSH
ncbi:MAG: hypothetical protein NZ602_03020 [Thermoguttaceae bacterium]|nr:hypothetical protein [Thermoguttaceae bacterium]MDW8036858.1 hypothetical protein [Thermoguttaceae bacterium]